MEGFKNIEQSNQTTEQNQENILDLGNKTEIIENYEYKDMFIDFINGLNPKNKERFLNILKNLPQEDLQEYLEDSFEDDSEENGEYFFDTFSEEYYIKSTNESLNDINPEIKNLINSIDNLIDSDKSNKLIIETYINQVNKFKKNNTNQIEIQLLDEKLNILNEYREINETKNEINEKTEKQRVEAEKQRIEAEKQRVEAEKQRVEAKTTEEKIEKKEQGKRLIREKIEIFQFDEKFYNILIEDSKLSNSTEKDDLLIKKMEDYLSQPGNAKKFFEQLAKNSPENYDSVYSALVNISPDLEKIFINEGIPNKFKEIPVPIPGPIPYFPEGGTIIKENNILKSGDKIVDISKIPPESYITTENGLKIKTKTHIPETFDLKAKYKRKVKGIDKQINKLETENKNLKNELSSLKDNLINYDKKLKEIEDSPIDEKEKIKVRENILQLKENTKLLIETKNKKYNINNQEITSLEKKKDILKQNFIDDYYKLSIKYKDVISKSDEKARKAIGFLDSIGIDSTLMGGLESMIKVINRNSGLRNKLGFDRRIDLANNDLGIKNDLGENGDNTIKTKEKFAQIMNILLSGSKGRPIDTSSMSTGITFKNESGEVLNKDTIMGDIKNKMGINIYGHMFKNAMEYDPSNEKSTD